MKFLKIILFFILIQQTLFAEKVEITSTSMRAENVKKEVHFIDDVHIKQGDDWLDADKVIVYFDENNETKMYEAIGFVTFEFKHEKHSFKGRANKVIYNMLTSRYVLRGNAVIDDNDFMLKRHVSGDEIILDMFTGRVNVKGGPISTKFFIKLHDTPCIII